MLPPALAQKLDALPASPGVYVFTDKRGRVLYVGKARSLRARVRSYFQPQTSDARWFIERLPAELGDLETFVTQNEQEAALLENALIKERQPRYNFKLRDDKEFLSIRLDPREAWPRLRVVRRPAQDGARYFGPYDSATAARKTSRLASRYFRLRTCTDADFASRVRPCLQHQIGRCPAPCVLEVDRKEYLAQAKIVGLFLDGRHDDVVDDLAARMRARAAALDYEAAARYRDQLRAIERVRGEQRVATARAIDQDAIALFTEAGRGELAVVEVRGGRITNVRTIDAGEVRVFDDEVVAAFVRQRYEHRSELPHEILLPVPIEAMEGLEAALSEGRARKVRLRVPERGGGRDLVAMARENAEHAFHEKRRSEADVEARLSEVQATLRLAVLPRRIECVDVSHLGGTDTVAAITALEDGALDRKRYRSFHVRGISGGDDFGAMREVLTRRLGRAAEPGWALPDLLVVDGGKGQLDVALAVLAELGVSLAACGLAKEKERPSGETAPERVFLPGQKNPVVLRPRSAAWQLLVLLRDEAHRASNLLRERLGRRRRLRSGLEDVRGLGKKTVARLLRALGSLRAIRAADETALVAAGATAGQARAILAYFAADAPAAGATADRAPGAPLAASDGEDDDEAGDGDGAARALPPSPTDE